MEEIKTESYADNQRRLAALRPRVKLLRRSPLFSLLPDLDLIRIASAALEVMHTAKLEVCLIVHVPRSHSPAPAPQVLGMEGQDLIVQGAAVDPEACFFFIAKGEAEVLLTHRDRDGCVCLTTALVLASPPCTCSLSFLTPVFFPRHIDCCAARSLR